MDIVNLILQGVSQARSGDYLGAFVNFSKALALIAQTLHPATTAKMMMATPPSSGSREELCDQLEAQCSAGGPFITLLPLILALIGKLLHG